MLFSEHDPGVAHRVRRDAPPYGPPAPAPYHPAPHHGPKGRVGPVYTFVKTDPQVMHPIFLSNVFAQSTFPIFAQNTRGVSPWSWRDVSMCKVARVFLE